MRVLYQNCHLRCDALSALKNTPIALLPEKPPKEEHNSSVNLLLGLGTCSTNGCHPARDVPFMKKDRSDSVPDGLEEVTLCKHVIIHLLHTVTKGTQRIVRPILLHQIIRRWGFLPRCEPSKESAFCLCFGRPLLMP
jgi:hypothetical protein